VTVTPYEETTRTSYSRLGDVKTGTWQVWLFNGTVFQMPVHFVMSARLRKWRQEINVTISQRVYAQDDIRSIAAQPCLLWKRKTFICATDASGSVFMPFWIRPRAFCTPQPIETVSLFILSFSFVMSLYLPRYVAPYSPYVNWRFGGKYCLHPQRK
jgi:hypothetical protein